MNTVPHSASQNKPHYVYTLAYPESMGGRVFYVGKGMNDRIYNHEYQARQGKKSHKCSIIRLIWQQGKKVAKKKIAFFATHEEACMYEIALIFFMPGLVNETNGGDGAWGLRHTEEARRKIGEASKGKIVSEETRQRLGKASKGRTHSEETKQRLRDIQNKRWASEEFRRKHHESMTSEETKRKISKVTKGRVHTEEENQRNREAHLGKVYSEETRQKIREAKLGKKASEETRQNIRMAALKREARKREQRQNNE